MTSDEIVERIMTAHWDMAACRCWLCTEGRAAGLRPRGKYLPHVDGNRENYPAPNEGFGKQ